MALAIGIDIGTTHVKVCAVDREGTVRTVCESDQQIIEIPGFGKGMDCDSLLQKVEGCLKQVLKETGSEEITAIGITSMAEAGVPVNEMGRPMAPILSWNSPPGREEFPEEISGFFLYQKTGLIDHPKYSLNRIRWYAQKKPDIFKKMKCFLSAADYIAFCLSGVFMTEESLASRTMLYNVTKQEWDQELTAFADMEGRLPRVMKKGEELPCIRKEQAQRYGLSGNVKICVSGHDHLCAALAEDLKPGEILNSMGTSEVYLCLTEKQELSRSFYERGILQGRFDGKNYGIVNLPSSGASVEWLRSFLTGEKKLSYQELMEEEPLRPSPLIYLPFVNGGGSHRSPDGLAGVLLGITQETDRTQVLQAINEGIACEGRVILRQMEEAGIKIERVISTGGGTKNTRLMQAKADIAGRKFFLAGSPQATAIGAALKAGGFPGRRGGQEKCVCPDEGLEKVYEERAKQYEKLIDCLAGFEKLRQERNR